MVLQTFPAPPAGSRLSEVINSGDLVSILRAAANDPTASKVTLGFRRYKIPSPAEIRLTRPLEIECTVGTEIEFTSTTPLNVKAPSTAGYPSLKTVTTGCVGLYFRGCNYRSTWLRIRNMTSVGHTGTMATAGHYYLIGSEVNRTELVDCVFNNREVQTYDTTNKSAVKAYSDRNFTSLTMVQFGTDRWEEPDVELTNMVDHVRVKSCYVFGEPLTETGTSTGVVRGFHLRKVASYDVDAFIGSVTNNDPQQGTDCVVSSTVANNETVIFTDWNPYTKVASTITYTAKTSPSGSAAYEVQAGTAAVFAAALANKINSNRADAGGTDFLQALTSDQFLPGVTDASVNVVRVQRLGVSRPIEVDNNKVETVYWQAWYPASVGAGTTSANITQRNISDGQRRFGYHQYGVWIEDSMPGETNLVVGTDNFAKDIYRNSASLPNLSFGKFLRSEGGHCQVKINLHAVTVKNVVHLQCGGFVDIPHSGNTWCQITAGTDAAPGNGLLAEPMPNYVQILSATARSANGGTYTLTDEDGNSVIFEFRQSGSATVGRTQVNTGASVLTEFQNLRKAIAAAYDAHTLKFYADAPETADAGTTYTMKVYAVTFGEYASAPTQATSGANLTLTNDNRPYRPCTVNFSANAHWIQTTEGHSAPLVNLDRVYGLAEVGGTLEHVRSISPAYSTHSWAIVRFGGATGVEGADGGAAHVNDVVTIDSQLDSAKAYIAVASGSPTGVQFTQGANGTASATNLATTINGQSGLSQAAQALLNFCIIVDGAPGIGASFAVNTTDNNNVIDLVGCGTLTLASAIAATSTLRLNIGSAVDFTFQAGGGTNVALTTYYINITTATTVAQQMAALKVAFDLFAVDLAAAYAAFALCAVDSNNRFQMFSSAFSATNTATLTAALDPGSKMTVKQFITGSDDPDLMGLRLPVVMKDVCQSNVTLSMFPFSNGDYTANSSGTSTDPAFTESYSAANFLPLTSFDLAFAQLSMKPIFAKKSGSGVRSKHRVNGHFAGPFGRGAITTKKCYSLGSNMADGDFVCTGSYIDGAAV